MQRTKLIAAAAALSTVIATPVLAQDMVQPRAAVHTNVAYTHRHYVPERRVYRNPGFWPGELAAGVVGGAIGTAGAIASIPFGGPYNSYDNGPYYNGYGPYAYNSYYHGGDFACTPGTYFRGEDGLTHICQ